jgi:ribosomal protein L35
MSKSKLKKVKTKTHKASVKRFKTTNPKGNRPPKVMHQGQRDGNGHSNNYMNRRQRKSPTGVRALNSAKEARKILRLINK